MSLSFAGEVLAIDGSQSHVRRAMCEVLGVAGEIAIGSTASVMVDFSLRTGKGGGVPLEKGMNRVRVETQAEAPPEPDRDPFKPDNNKTGADFSALKTTTFCLTSNGTMRDLSAELISVMPSKSNDEKLTRTFEKVALHNDLQEDAGEPAAILRQLQSEAMKREGEGSTWGLIPGSWSEKIGVVPYTIAPMLGGLLLVAAEAIASSPNNLEMDIHIDSSLLGMRPGSEQQVFIATNNPVTDERREFSLVVSAGFGPAAIAMCSLKTQGPSYRTMKHTVMQNNGAMEVERTEILFDTEMRNRGRQPISLTGVLDLARIASGVTDGIWCMNPDGKVPTSV